MVYLLQDGVSQLFMQLVFSAVRIKSESLLYILGFHAIREVACDFLLKVCEHRCVKVLALLLILYIRTSE